MRTLGKFLPYALVLALLSYSWMYDSMTVPNERSRVYAVAAMVDDGSLAVDAQVKRWGKTLDAAYRDSRTYSDKAPGSALLGAAVYSLAALLTDTESWSAADMINTMRTWLMIPLGLLGFALLRRLLGKQGLSPPTVEIVSLGWILGSAAFHYSTAFYGHQIVAVALLASISLIEDSADRQGGLSRARMTAAGFLLGFACLTEYQSGLLGILCAGFVFFSHRRGFVAILLFAAGAAIPIAALLIYNNEAFGSPFTLPYHHLSEKMQNSHSAGIAGVSFPPKFTRVGNLIISLHRGVVPTSPFFLLALPGWWAMWKRNKRSLALFTLLAFVLYWGWISCARIWHGGWAFGPRLMVPILGALAIPAAHGFEHIGKKRHLWAPALGLFLAAIAYNQAVHLVLPEISPSARNPLLDVVVPAIAAGRHTPNLLSVHLGAPWALSLCAGVALSLAAMLHVTLVGVKREPTYMGRVRKGLIAWSILIPLATAILLFGPSMS